MLKMEESLTGENKKNAPNRFARKQCPSYKNENPTKNESALGTRNRRPTGNTRWRGKNHEQ
jgi:hypothetical protein